MYSCRDTVYARWHSSAEQFHKTRKRGPGDDKTCSLEMINHCNQKVLALKTNRASKLGVCRCGEGWSCCDVMCVSVCVFQNFTTQQRAVS